MKKHFLVPVLSILSLTSIADASTNNPKNVNKLDDVVVTATRTAISADDSIVPVVIIDSEDIEKSAAKDLVTLLSGTAGIDISNTGGLGKQSSIFIRGTNSDHVVVLIDGVRVGSATLGSTAFEHIPLSQIDRIEIVKGPRSSLYGSDAIGGVIQIFTKKGSAEQGGITPAVTVGIGSNETHKVNFSAAGGKDGFNFYLGGNSLRSEGYNAMSENNQDRDGFKSDSVLLNVGKLWESGAQLDLMYMGTNNKNEFDNSYSPNNAFHSTQSNNEKSAKFAIPIGDKVDVSLQINESVEDAVNYMDGVQTSKFESTRRGQNLQFNFRPIDEIAITVGNDYKQDQVDGTTAYSTTNIETDSRYLQGLFEFGMVNLLGGYRYDDISSFGDEETWNLGFRINPTGTPLSITPSVGTAFKAPTLNDLYWPADAWSQGNPDLLPETSKTVDLGLAWDGEQLDVALNIYHTEVENLISWQLDQSWVYSPVNIGKAVINGREFSISLQSRIVNLGVEIAHLEAKDSATNKYLLRRANESIKIKLDKAIGDFDFAIDLIGYGKSYADAANLNAIPGYGILNGVIGFQLNKSISFTLRGENLFDKQYSTARGSYYDSNTFQSYSYEYNAPGRSFMLEMKAGL